jgi:glycosyltransferase involved in cell wall biosynthesis
LLANSLFTQQQMLQTFGLQAEVCYLGVDVDFFSPLQDVKRQDYVLSVGELTPRKGFDFLIQSLGLVDAARRPALHLASNYEDAQEKAYLQQLAASLDVKLVLSGKLDNEQLRLEYNQAQLCLYASLQEPFGLVPLEAMACGTPVIGVAEGGISESVQDGVNGCLVARAPDTFAAAIVDLLQDRQRLAQYGRQARASVLKSWRWEQAVERLEMYLSQRFRYERS